MNCRTACSMRVLVSADDIPATIPVAGQDPGAPCRAGGDRRRDGDPSPAASLDLVPLEQRAADDHALDLRGALADEKQRGVPVEALDLVLLGVAVAAVDAERVLDALLAGLGGEQLRHP